VEAFLSKKINFIQISELIDKTLAKVKSTEISSVEHIIEVDSIARKESSILLKKML
jgi:1-deoxy-D-xylulose 5-phosphate reductoisomerase